MTARLDTYFIYRIAEIPKIGASRLIVTRLRNQRRGNPPYFFRTP
jgi:hypothetical protein